MQKLQGNRISGSSDRRRLWPVIGLLAIAALVAGVPAQAMPAFARQYGVSCAVCHDAFPRLNAGGDAFVAGNYRLPNWRDTALDVGDERLALPRTLPLALRVQAFLQTRSGKDIDPATGATANESRADVQAPYLVKLLSSAPLSEHVSFYFYGIFAEKGGNNEVIIEDAWFSYDDLFGTGVAAQLGQFQVSDLMFPREVRLTFQDFYAYRAAGITYDRGLILDRAFGPVDLALGLVNGNGIEQNFSIDSPGYRRPDKMFDNDTDKSYFGRVGFGLGPVDVGLFALAGRQASAAGFAGSSTGSRQTNKRIAGVDLSGTVAGNVHWFAQGLWNRWDGFLDAAPARDFDWFGGFAGVDYVRNDRWAFSLLYNFAEADEFEGTGTIYEGIAMNSLSAGVSYYIMRNLKLVAEVNADLLEVERSGPPFVGHQSREHNLLVGFDAAF